VFCTGIAYILYFRLIQHAGPARAHRHLRHAAVRGRLRRLFLHEQITPWMLGCGLVIICGTALSTGLIQIKR
jgi:drug/metabolite transporter (DMT)-like permease